MTKYIIKTPYLEGPHAGKEHYVIKGGYVVCNLDNIWQSDSYTLGTCKAVCKRYAMNNEIANRIEKRDREYAAAKGRSVVPYMIHYLQSYTPVEIETVD